MESQEFSKNQIKQLQAIIVDPIKQYIDEKFAENQVEHEAMQETLSEHTGQLAEIANKVKNLNEDRISMVRRQDRLEKSFRHNS